MGAHDGGEVDDGSVGASSRGIRPYAKERKGSTREARATPDRQDPRSDPTNEIIAYSAQARSPDADSFALDVQRVPARSSKNYTGTKSIRRRSDLLGGSIPDQDESFKLDINAFFSLYRLV